MRGTFLKLCAALTYAVMIIVNYLATALPINNRSTGAISDAYPNLFAPAGPAFSIWGLIYLLLAGYVVYQFLNKNPQTQMGIKNINPLFIASSLANSAWIFAWHYDFIGTSVFVMGALLVLLILIADILKTMTLTSIEKITIWMPFSVYFGWITVAMIANISVYLVSIGWNGFGVSDVIWTCVILLVGAVIGMLRMYQDRNIVYGAVFVWAYAWILFKHLSESGFQGAYPSISVVVFICLIVFLFSLTKLALRK